eukprot:3303578-Pyramimonas_sp.AAC.1
MLCTRRPHSQGSARNNCQDLEDGDVEACRINLETGYLEAGECLVDPFSRMAAKVDESPSRLKLAFLL